MEGKGPNRSLSEKLVERFVRYCKVKNLQIHESPTQVSCVMPTDVFLTVYKRPEVAIGWYHPFYFYGMIRYPKRKYKRELKITEGGAEHLCELIDKQLNIEDNGSI